MAETDTTWYYANTDKEGVKTVQSIDILNWNGSAAVVVASEAGKGNKALAVGRPTSVAAETLFRGKKNIG